MKIYTITFESNIFQSLVAENLEIWKTDALKFDGSSKIEKWSQPAFRVQNPKLKIGDFVGVGPGCIGIRQSAKNKLIDFFEQSGEMLPIKPETLNIEILNVIDCCDCLDHDKTLWVFGDESKKPIRIKSYAFKKELIPETFLFKIPELAKSKILVHNGFDSSEKSFIQIVKELNLKGIRFDEIWSDENSGNHPQ